VVGGAVVLVPLLTRPQPQVTVTVPPKGTAGAAGSTPVAGAATAAATGTQAPGTGRLTTVFDDRFVSSQNSWPNKTDSTAFFGDGGYHLLARQPGQFVAIGAPVRGPVNNGFKDVVVTGVGGPVGGGYGLIVRDGGPGSRDGVNQNGRFYVFEVGDKGEVGIWRRDGDTWVDILPWTASDVVAKGDAPNTLSVQAIGSQLSFIVNGQQVANPTDATLTEGAVGIFVGGDGNEVVIERFLVQVPGA
jgi:hypothetical protein